LSSEIGAIDFDPFFGFIPKQGFLLAFANFTVAFAVPLVE